MQLHQDIPTLGGLVPAPPSRLDALREQGAAAGREVATLLARAGKRLQLLGAARVLCLALAVIAAALLAGALGSFALGPVGGRAIALALLAAGALGIALWWRGSSLQHPGDRVALARLLGGPSELLSSVELSAPGSGEGASRELLALLHVRAAESARKIELGRALPLSVVRWPLSILCAALAVLVAAVALSPQRVRTGLRRLALGELPGDAAELAPIAGDLAITYLYPAYTGLPPRTEEVTAGDLRGPRGTEVRLTARADRDLAQAFAVVNGAAVKLDASGPGNRLLSGTLTLAQPGQWQLRFANARGRVLAEGPPRPVEIVADTPPAVTIDAPTQKTVEVDPQGRLPLSWSASDDFGLTQVALVYQPAGGKEERIVLESPGAPAKRLRGSYQWDLSPLKLRAGDKISYYVEAKDNDAIDGPQRGVSATQSIKVFSEAEHIRESLLRAQALWERLVALLGDRLEEKEPPAQDDQGDWYRRTSSKDKDARALSVEIGNAGRELSKDKLAPKEVRGPLGRALIYAASGLGPLVQRTSLSRAPLSQGVSGKEGARRLLAHAVQTEAREEEKDVLYLQDLLDKARLDAMQEIGKELAASRRELARLAEKLRKAPDEATKQELLAEVERLRERVQDLMQRMSELAKGINDEHLNQEAVQSAQKENDLLSQLTDVQKKLQSGKVDDALKQLDQLGAQLEKLEKQLADKSSHEQGQKYSEEAQKLKEAAGELKRIEDKERDLARRTAALRKEERAQAQKRFEQKGGKELAKKLREKVAEAKKAIHDIAPKVAEHLGMEDVLEAAEGRVDDLERALSLGDFDEGLELAQRGLRAVETLQGRLSMEQQVAARYPGFSQDPQAVDKALKGSTAAAPKLREVVSQLEDALPRPGQGLSPEQQKEMQQQGREQRELKQELGQVREKLSEVGKKAPLFGPKHEQMLQEAEGGMGEAEEKLGRGEPRGAQAGESQALEKLQQFEDAMQELAKQSKGGQGQGGIPLPWGDAQGEDQGDEEGNSDSTRHEKVEIPDAEASRAPAEFRKELLDAMKQSAPEKYKERVKQYYEELVK